MLAKRFLNMPICNIANPQNFFQDIDITFIKMYIPWSILVTL